MYLRALAGYQSIFGQNHARYQGVDEQLKALAELESHNSVMLDNDTDQGHALESHKRPSILKTIVLPSRRQRFLKKVGLK
jgi:hypothetical protein